MVKALISTGSVCQNRKARFRYTVLETIDAGIILTVKEMMRIISVHSLIPLDRSLLMLR